MTDKYNIAVLILSCDKFYDTWDPLFYSFRKYWGDCNYPLKLLTNYKSPNYENVEVIDVGEDLSWSHNLIEALRRIDEDYVLLWLDDVFLVSNVDQAMINDDIQWMKDNDVDYLRLRRSDQKANREKYSRLDEEGVYRASIFSTVWKKDVLERMLDGSETAWQFEFRASKRSKEYPNFYQVNHDRINYLHAIEKGVWQPLAVKWMIRNELDVDLSYRRELSFIQMVFYQLNKIKGIILDRFTNKTKKRILDIAQSIYVRTGIRSADYYDSK